MWSSDDAGRMLIAFIAMSGNVTQPNWLAKFEILIGNDSDGGIRIA